MLDRPAVMHRLPAHAFRVPVLLLGLATILLLAVTPVNAGAVGFGPSFSLRTDPYQPGGSNPSDPRVLADFTGDARSDILVLSLGTWYVSTSTGSDATAFTVWHETYGVGGVPIVGDVNGDGRADLSFLQQGKWYVALSGGSSFGVLQTWSTSSGLPPGTIINRKLLADVTGDGKADAIIVSGTKWFVAQSSGTSFGAFTQWGGGSGWLDGSPANVGVIAADVTGDKKADAIVVQNGTWSVGRAGASAFAAPGQWATGLGLTSGGASVKYMAADLTGDGRSDAVAVSNGQWKIASSNGTSFGAAAVWSANFAIDDFYVADVTGNGTADAVASGATWGWPMQGSWYAAASDPAGPTPLRNGAGWTRIFGDEFDGTSLDETKWRDQRDDWFTDEIYQNFPSETPERLNMMRGTPYNDAERAFYQSANVAVANGQLSLTVRDRTSDPVISPSHDYDPATGIYDYTTGTVNTGRRFASASGYAEARIKVPSCAGCWPSFWLLPLDDERPPELDVFEFFPNASPELLGRPQASVYPTPNDADSGGAMEVELTATSNDANNNKQLDVGESISYDYRVVNRYSETITAISVDDPLVGGAVNCPATSLLAGASMQCVQRNYTITSTDVWRGFVRNNVSATGSTFFMASPMQLSDVDGATTVVQNHPVPYGTAGKDYRGDWHTYGIQWGNGAIQVNVDGIAAPSILGGGTAQPMYLILLAAVAKGYSTPDNSRMEVDYVRVFQRGPM